MKRVLLAAALIAFAGVSHAQRPQPLPQPLPRPVPLPTPTLPGASVYLYTAQTAATVRRSGAVRAGTLTWSCSGARCTIRGPWPQPGVAACAALAREVGRIVAYGREGAMLTAAQLTQCNADTAQPAPAISEPPPSAPAGISITTTTLRAEGAPEAGAPAPFTALDITTTTLRAEGSPEAGAPAPHTPVDITTSTLRAEGAPQ